MFCWHTRKKVKIVTMQVVRDYFICKCACIFEKVRPGTRFKTCRDQQFVHRSTTFVWLGQPCGYRFPQNAKSRFFCATYTQYPPFLHDTNSYMRPHSSKRKHSITNLHLQLQIDNGDAKLQLLSISRNTNFKVPWLNPRMVCTNHIPKYPQRNDSSDIMDAIQHNIFYLFLRIGHYAFPWWWYLFRSLYAIGLVSCRAI